MQYNVQTNDKFRYRWNNYKDNYCKILRGEDLKEAGFFAHFQTSGYSAFVNDTEIRFIDKIDPSGPIRHEEVSTDTLNSRCLQGFTNNDPYYSGRVSSFFRVQGYKP